MPCGARLGSLDQRSIVWACDATSGSTLFRGWHRYRNSMNRQSNFGIVAAFLSTLSSTRLIGAEPLVSITPAKITLLATDPDAREGGRRINFSISNRTARPQRFNRFYGGFWPILVPKEAARVIPFDFARDVTWIPKPDHFPIVAPGKSAESNHKARVVTSEKGLLLEISASPAGAYFFTVIPGSYKLCISYSGQGESDLIESGRKHRGVKTSGVWTGWQMSNWIDLEIVAK